MFKKSEIVLLKAISIDKSVVEHIDSSDVGIIININENNKSFVYEVFSKGKVHYTIESFMEKINCFV